MRAVAYDEHGVAEPGDAHLPVVERDADTLVAACRSVLAHVGEGDLLAISCFWHSLLALDERAQPLTPVLTWRDLSGIPPALDPVAYHRRTGCFLHPSYWPAKIPLLPAAARYVSFGDYLLLHLTGELRTSVSLASGTGLYDPNRLDWDDETLAAIGVERAQLPPVAAGPVGLFGDGACSNVGAGCVTPGRAAVMIGTSAAARVLREAPAEPRDGLFLYRLDDERYCEGGALSDGGNLHAWLVRTLQPFDAEQIAAREPAAHGVVFGPFLGGERALGWDADRRGSIAGLSFATTPLDIAQAALEAVCYRLADVVDAIGGVESVVATGGALLASPGWTQILADVLGRPVEVSAVPEGSARGAALAMLGSPFPPAPVARVVSPRPERFEIHCAARREQDARMRA